MVEILSCSGEGRDSNRGIFLCFQVVVVIRETTTAKAIRTPHRHLSHTTCRHVAAQPRLPSPAPVVETARPFRGRTTPAVFDAANCDWVTSPTFGGEIRGKRAVGVVDSEGSGVGSGVSGVPRSFSPMFGRCRRQIGNTHHPIKRHNHDRLLGLCPLIRQRKCLLTSGKASLNLLCCKFQA